jgi:Cu-processing system ATP-binding protein
MPAAPAIEARGVTRRFGDTVAVDQVDLVVREGVVFGLIGHNGAGKSTLIRMMLGLLAPDAGELRVAGSTMQGERSREARRRIAYLPENVVLYPNLTAIETLRFFAQLKGVDPAGCRAVLGRVGLLQAALRPVRGYSKGMRQRLGFAQALLGSPRILFLDEPTNGLDPGGIREFYAILAELRAQGVTIVLSSHNLHEIQDRVDEIALMRAGRVQAAGTVQALRRQLDLPARIVVTVAPGGEAALREALAPVVHCQLTVEMPSARIECPRGEKLRVLAALARCAVVISDVELNEPSLEDVFLGFSTGIGPPA